MARIPRQQLAVAAGEDHWELWQAVADGTGQIQAVHARHHDVAEHHMEARGIPFQLGQGLVRIARKDHAVLELAQGADRKLGHVDVVFHHQHADAMTMLQSRLRRRSVVFVPAPTAGTA